MIVLLKHFMQKSNSRIMIDLPLVDEHTSVLRNVVAIDGCVFSGAERNKTY